MDSNIDCGDPLQRPAAKGQQHLRVRTLVPRARYTLATRCHIFYRHLFLGERTGTGIPSIDLCVRYAVPECSR